MDRTRPTFSDTASGDRRRHTVTLGGGGTHVLVLTGTAAPSARTGQHAVVDDRGADLTHAQLGSRRGVGRDLAAHGVRPRDIVTIMLPNIAEWQVAMLACLRLGAVPAVIPVTSAPMRRGPPRWRRVG
ncbi:long-chain fatty acid--CoA ligase [Pseudonocardia sp. MCCB 268]|nr:long-chain fatty acid--CoA ligase [Pseudonocardia cytotoxica]